MKRPYLACSLIAIAVTVLVTPMRPLLADEACRFEKCDIPLMSQGASFRTICGCYKNQCRDSTIECACDEARDKEGLAITDKGKEAGKIDIKIVPNKVAKGGQAQITVDIALTEGRTDEDAGFRVDVSSGSVTPNVFTINRRAGTSPAIKYTPLPNAPPGDVL